MKFIKLTGFNGTPFYLNAEMIEEIAAKDGETRIWAQGAAEDDYYVTKETPEEIMYILGDRTPGTK